MKLILTGKTQKGKRVVKENGELWEVVSDKPAIQISKTHMIAPVGFDKNSTASRWVNLENDGDFSIKIAKQ